MSYIGQQLPADVFSGYVTDTFTGDGSATTFTLSKAPFSEDGLIVVVDNVIQQPTTNFTVSGTTLTIVGTAILSGIKGYAIHTSGAVPSTLASKLDTNGVSDALILDADADTTISADTDDQIDFKAGGTDVMSMTATGLTINDGTTITTADNTDTLTLKSTDADANVGPVLNLHRDSASPADDDLVGSIRYSADNDAGEQTNLFQTNVFLADASDGTEDFQFEMDGMIAGTQRNYLTMYGGGIIFNEDSQDIDFRVESNDRTSMLNVDAALNKVGIGDVPDLGMLHVKVADSGGSADANSDTLVLEESGSGGITILSGSSNNGNIYFGDGDSNNRGIIEYKHGDNDFNFYTTR